MINEEETKFSTQIMPPTFSSETIITVLYINQQNAQIKIKLNTYHKTHFILCTNRYMFRHPVQG